MLDSEPKENSQVKILNNILCSDMLPKENLPVKFRKKNRENVDNHHSLHAVAVVH
jgi:hypothetical protein